MGEGQEEIGNILRIWKVDPLTESNQAAGALQEAQS